MTEVVYDLLASQPGVREFYHHDFQPQVDANLARIPGRFNPETESRGSLAIVGFGPTLQDTWLNVVRCDTIWTVSGAHDFLLARNVVPHYHTDIEWRDHKVKFIHQLHPEVHYVIASTIAPNYLERVTTEQVSIFHIEQTGGNAVLPKDALTVQPDWDVVMSVLRLAAAMGFKEIHLFGIDYCGRIRDGAIAAGVHHGIPKALIQMGLEGKVYLTSTDMVEGCWHLPKVMGQYPDIEYFVHGDGMFSHYLRARLGGQYANQRIIPRVEQTPACIE